MKASRAPGPVSYMHLHAAKGKGGAKNDQRPGGSKSAPAEAGGVLRKFKDIDNIPDFSWGESEVDFQTTRCPPSKSAGALLSHDQNDDDSDDFNDACSGKEDIEYVRDDHRSSRPLTIPKRGSYEPPRQVYNDAGDFNEVNHPRHTQKPSPKAKPPLSSRTQYSSDEDNFDSEFDSEQKMNAPSKQSPRTSQMKMKKQLQQPSVTKPPPPLPAQLEQQKVQSQIQRQEQKPITLSHARNSSRISNNGSNSDNPAKANQNQLVPTPTEAIPNILGLKISTVDRIPPLPCEKPLNQPKGASALSPTNLTDQDKLYFTKQPRNVEFKPYTLKQYQLIKPKEYVEISKMKPDLNTDELIAKRRNAERIKEFSKQLRSFNQETITQQPKLPSATEQSDLNIAKAKYESNRQRALEFAKHVPRPKVISEDDNGGMEQATHKPRSKSAQRRHSTSAETPSDSNRRGLVMDEDAFQMAKLQELEAKHQQSKAKMEAIKKSLHGF